MGQHWTPLWSKKAPNAATLQTRLRALGRLVLFLSLSPPLSHLIYSLCVPNFFGRENEECSEENLLERNGKKRMVKRWGRLDGVLFYFLGEKWEVGFRNKSGDIVDIFSYPHVRDNGGKKGGQEGRLNVHYSIKQQ